MESIDSMLKKIISEEKKMTREQKIHIGLAAISVFMSKVLRFDSMDAMDSAMIIKAVFYIGEACGVNHEEVLLALKKDFFGN